MDKFSTVILAAGMGTRMKSEKCKVLHEICSKPLVKWVYEACEKAGSEKTVLVVGNKKEDVIASMGEDKLYAVQEVRLGTGHAVMQTEAFLKDYEGTVVVLNGDTPLISAETIANAVAYHKKTGNSATVISAILDDPTVYGRIVRNEFGDFIKITEQKDATEAEKQICEINSGMYCFDAEDLYESLSKVTNDNVQKEYYLTDTISILRTAGKSVGAFAANDYQEILGVNDRLDLSVAQKIKQMQINKKVMLSGVTLIDPENTYIDQEAIIGTDTVVYPGCIIKGSTTIEAGCTIGPNTTIENAFIGKETQVKNSVVLYSSIGANTTVGPFAYIRPDCKIGSHVRLGDFVEIKNSVIDDGTKVSHLTYVGDSDVGRGINFGCGTVTVNYDGEKKHRTVIEDDAFIGCNTNLVAPVTVKKNAFIAAGSTITDDVSENALAIARARQINKENWRKNK